MYWIWFCPLFAVIKASVLSAHDKGTHVVVLVKVRKVLRSGLVPLSQGTHSLYPLSWTSRGCTCPVLNPGEGIPRCKYVWYTTNKYYYKVTVSPFFRRRVSTGRVRGSKIWATAGHHEESGGAVDINPWLPCLESSTAGLHVMHYSLKPGHTPNKENHQLEENHQTLEHCRCSGWFMICLDQKHFHQFPTSHTKLIVKYLTFSYSAVFNFIPISFPQSFWILKLFFVHFK